MIRLLKSLAATALLACAALAMPAHADKTKIARGGYLVSFSGCNDCHTPGYFFGKPDMARFLSGSDVAFEIPGLGAFIGPNLTSDPETGLGKWTDAEIVTALQTGERPDGRMLAPIMPWHALANLSKDDAAAMAAYLKSLKPIRNQVPGPFGVGETVPTFMFRILPPGGTVAAPPK